jgi:hypothetical protein
MSDMELNNRVRFWIIRKLLSKREQLSIWESLTDRYCTLMKQYHEQKDEGHLKDNAYEIWDIKQQIEGKNNFSKWN